jgi:PAS domain S-box-containing protein
MPQLAELLDVSAAEIPGVGRYVWDVRSDILYWSKRLLDVYGLSDPPTGEVGFYGLLHPEDRVRVEAETAFFLASGRQYDHRFRIIRPDGEVRTIIDRGVIERDPGGPAVALHGMNIDVTGEDQGTVPPAPGHSDGDAFRLLADNIDQCSWIADASGSITWYNRRWFDFTGTTFEEMAGWGWRKVHHPDHVDRVVTEIARCFETGEPWQDVFPLRGKDGDYRWFLSRALPVRDARGSILYWFGTNTDISDQRRSEAHLSMLAESVPQLVWSADAKGSIDYYNSRISDYGSARNPQTGAWDWSVIIHPDDLVGTAEAWSASAEHRAPYSYAHRLRMADGSYRWHLSRAVPLIGDGGEVEHWFGTATDIDEIKQAQILRQVLLDEANHRIKNILTLVQSLARLSLQTAGDGKYPFETFYGRLESLAAAHILLVEGLDRQAALFSIVGGVFEACGIDPRRLSCTGVDQLVSRDAGLMISLALHELCTNSIKYGALASATGHIGIVCSPAAEGRTRIVWTEHGGPPVRAPQRRGLGTRLVERALASAIRGTATLDFRPAGVVCVIEGRIAVPEAAP